MGKALILVDIQTDFVSGSLPVPGASVIVPEVNKLMQSESWDFIVACKDYHPANHVSFASNHPGYKVFDEYKLTANGNLTLTKLWPDHCVQNTAGSEFAEGLDVSKIQEVIYKGTVANSEFYSAVCDIFGNNETQLITKLNEKKITEVHVVGLALDFCVMYTALDIHKHGFKTVVRLGYVKAITEQGKEDAIKRLESAGVACING